MGDTSSILTAPRNAAARQVIGGQLDFHFIAGIDTDEIHTHFSGDMCHNPVAILQFHLEHGIWKGLNYFTFHFDHVAFGQCQPSLHSERFVENPCSSS